MSENFCERIGCNSCKLAKQGKCKREYQRLTLSKPTFGCDRFSTLRFCSDYDPCDWRVALKATWQGFEDWYAKYVADWGQSAKTITFVLDGDENVRYHVKIEDFINGELFENGKFKAVLKEYYTKTRKGFGHKLIKEEIDGLVIN